MAYVNTGLPNNGSTMHFAFVYDDSLPAARGKDLAAGLMSHCEGDLFLMQGWFPNVNIHLPITVKLAAASHRVELGASWIGWGPIMPEVTLKLGTFPVAVGTPLMVLRYLMILEVSEMFMRERQPFGANDWFGLFNEGSIGEALSNFLGAQFVVSQGADDLPGADLFALTPDWINSARDNHVDDPQGDLGVRPVVGCGILFLSFLRDQLGFGITEIINAGGPTLAHVFSHLTSRGTAEAFPAFADLVNRHYPQDPTTPNKITYTPQLETLFPVSDLSAFQAPREMTWVTTASTNRMTLAIDHPAQTRLRIMLSSSNDFLIHVPPEVFIERHGTSVSIDPYIRPQGLGFAATSVDITASYAGKTVTAAIHLVPPEQFVLPSLQIIPESSGDPCQDRRLAAGTTPTFMVKNVDVLTGIWGRFLVAPSYRWAVTGASAADLNNPLLSMDALPRAGSNVDIMVTVTLEDPARREKLIATGSLHFKTANSVRGLGEIQGEILCRVRRLMNAHAYIPPWVPIEEPTVPVLESRLEKLESGARAMMQETERAIAAIEELKVAVKAAAKAKTTRD